MLGYCNTICGFSVQDNSNTEKVIEWLDSNFNKYNIQQKMTSKAGLVLPHITIG